MSAPLDRSQRPSTTHDDLVIRAERWLRSIGCGVTFRELVANVSSGEIPDAIGWKYGVSILIECKISRADFLSDKKKRFRQFPEHGMGDWRFFFCPEGIIQPDDLPAGWGLLHATPKTVLRVHGAPKGNAGWGSAPFQGHKRYETMLMASALRRLHLRGHLETIYDPAPSAASDEANQTVEFAR